ncbi:MAG: PorP/SprF family type IX secretion system membrane protein [Bacteroidia bacterium]|nr:PorP/SprF family type IX secretion system membrane protein [Bacteroidia bacterium]
MKKVFIYPCLLILGFLGLSHITQAQDVNYSQFFSSPLYYNPAFTGINTGLRARFVFRDQWPSLPIDFKSYYFSADIGDRNLPGAGGIGIMINSDSPGAGLINTLQAALTIGVRVPVTSFMVAQIGVKAAILQRKVNWDDFVFADQLDPKYGAIYQTSFIPPDANTRVVPDFAAGGILQFSNEPGNISGSIGFAVDHLFKPDVSLLSDGSAQYPRKWVVHGDAIFATGYGSSSSMYGSGDDPLMINPGFMFISQANLNSLEIGLNLLKFNVYLGGWYKSTMTGDVNNSIALLAGYRFMFMQDMSIKFIYSYDLQIAGVMQGTGGAHEISLVLEFDGVSLFGGSGSSGSGSRGFVPTGRSRGYGPLECPSFY